MKLIDSCDDISCIGSGGYAKVYKYTIKRYGMKVAIKQLNNDVTYKEKRRFKNEFSMLHSFNHINIVKAYMYCKNEEYYTMELCDMTLYHYIRANNQKISDYDRYNLAIQFLNGMDYIHKKNKLHRDLSYGNVLIKKYDSSLIIKISDFGLVKDLNFNMTSAGTDNNRGTIVDPLLESFANYNKKNEIYSIGVILCYIFTGRKSIELSNIKNEKIRDIIKKCTDISSLNNRYNDVSEVIVDLNNCFDKKKKSDEISISDMLLIEAYNDKSNNVIEYFVTLSSEYIKVNNKNIDLYNMTKRDKVLYFEAIDKLFDDGYLNLEYYRSGVKRYSLTTKAYEYVDNFLK